MEKILKHIIGALPQNAISSVAGKFANSSFSKLFIRSYARKFNIDLDIIEKPIDQYETLNEFFTRKLKTDARPIDQEKNSIISPVDGTIAQLGDIQSGKIIQAKGIQYSVEDLIGKENAMKYHNGKFMTIYLSPKDYHRIHMPLSGEITGYDYIPGRLYPVNNIGVNQVNGLFTKNERLTTYVKSDKETALVKVGAFIVGSVKLSYQDNVHNLHRGNPYKGVVPKDMMYGKGEEIAMFEFGSTVVLLFEDDFVEFDPSLKPNMKVRMGKKIGNLTINK